jgi:hypothetical protein
MAMTLPPLDPCRKAMFAKRCHAKAGQAHQSCVRAAFAGKPRLTG